MATGRPTSLSVAVEFTSGVWTDVTDAVMVQAQPVTINVGRASDASGVQPGTLSFIVENPDGTWTPDNPTSTLYTNLIEGKRVRVQVVKGSTSTRFLGRITTIAPTFDQDPALSTTLITASDALGALQAHLLRGPLAEYTAQQARSNWVADYFPFDDREGSAQAASDDLTFYSTRALVAVAGVAPSFGQGGLANEAGAAVTLNVGCTLVGSPNVEQFTSLVDVWLAAVDTSTGVIVSTSSINFGSLSLQLSSTGRVRVSRISSTGVVVDSGLTDRGPKLTDGAVHHLAYFPGYDLSTHTTTDYLIVDGVTVWTSAAYTSSGHPLGYSKITVGPPSVGSITLTHLCFSQLPTGSTSNVLTRWGRGRASAANPTTITEVVTDLGSWSELTPTTISSSSTRSITFGGSKDKTALDYTAYLSRAETGIAYHDYTLDRIVLPTQAESRSSTVAFTLDVVADGDGDVVAVRNNVGRSTQVDVSSPTNPSVLVSNVDAITTFGIIQTSVDCPLINVNEMWSLGSDTLAPLTFKTMRIARVAADLLSAQNDLYASLFALTIGERVRITNLPSTYFGSTFSDGYVTGWTEEISLDAYRVTFDLDAADAPAENVFDTGRLGFGDGVATVSALTTSGTSVVITWSGSQSLSTVAGDYPLDLNIAGERCTVTAAPGGSSSPQTLTITRGVAPTLARAHVAGDTVDLWDTTRFAL